MVPTMINASKAGTEKLRRRKHENPPQPDERLEPMLPRPHSLLAAAPEDPADLHRQTAEVTAVQTHPHRPVAQLTEGQGHRAEVQKTAAERHTDVRVSDGDTCWLE